MGKNNFTNDETKAKSKYRLAVGYLPGSNFYQKVGPGYNYYSFNSKPDHVALQKLIDLFNARQGQIKDANIYDNLSNTELSKQTLIKHLK